MTYLSDQYDKCKLGATSKKYFLASITVTFNVSYIFPYRKYEVKVEENTIMRQV